MSILIVEDDPFVANTIREVLGELGFCRCRSSVPRQRARSSMLSRLRSYSRSNVERWQNPLEVLSCDRRLGDLVAVAGQLLFDQR
jgi:CheY-like chemotaxis protein